MDRMWMTLPFVANVHIFFLLLFEEELEKKRDTHNLVEKVKQKYVPVRSSHLRAIVLCLWFIERRDLAILKGKKMIFLRGSRVGGSTRSSTTALAFAR